MNNSGQIKSERGPTKSKRRRANERQRKALQAKFDEELGPIPYYILEAAETLPQNTGTISGQDNWERAPPHVVEWDEFPAVDKGKLVEMSQAAASERSRERAERISQMKSMCHDIWGQRGAAHIVAKRWRDSDEEEVSIRTIQQYIRESRK